MAWLKSGSLGCPIEESKTRREEGGRSQLVQSP